MDQETMREVVGDAGPRPFWLDPVWLASPMASEPRFWPTTKDLSDYYQVSMGAVRVKGQYGPDGTQVLPAVQLGAAKAYGGVSVWRFNPRGLPESPQAWRERFKGGKNTDKADAAA